MAIETQALGLGMQLRRRPAIYAGVGFVTCAIALLWSVLGLLWIASICAIIALAAIARPETNDETLVANLVDVTAISMMVAMVGITPAAGTILWAGTLVAAYFTLDRRSGHLVGITGLAGYLATEWLDGRLAVIELTEVQTQWTTIIAIVLGFGHFFLVVPYIAQIMHEAIADASELAENRRRQSEFRASIASTVAHELRTPIAGIRGFVEILSDQNDTLSVDERSEFLEIVSSQATSLNAIVEDVLVAMRDEHGQLEVDRVEFDLSETVTRTVKEMGPEISSQVTVDASASVTAHGDPLRVAQIIRNLVTNAVKYGGDRIDISVASGHRATVSVGDDGDPIPADEAANIFEPFHRLEGGSSGYGLGLPISRRLASAMGGDLEYRDQPKSFVLSLHQNDPTVSRDLGFGGAVGGA